MTTKQKETGGQSVSLPLSQLRIHPIIQRDFRPQHAEHIEKKFDPAKLGVICVTPSSDRGFFDVFDGQHRVAAARAYLGDENQEIDCRIYPNGDIGSLAGLQLGLDDRKNWRAVDKFPLRVLARDWAALVIHGTLHQFNLHIGEGTDDGTVRAVGACDWIIQKIGGQAALEYTIRVLNHAWSNDQDAYHNVLLRGVALLHNRYGEAVDSNHLIERLRKSGGPARMLGRARDFAKPAGITLPQAAAQIMANEYNKGLRTKRLTVN